MIILLYSIVIYRLCWYIYRFSKNTLKWCSSTNIICLYIRKQVPVFQHLIPSKSRPNSWYINSNQTAHRTCGHRTSGSILCCLASQLWIQWGSVWASVDQVYSREPPGCSTALRFGEFRCWDKALDSFPSCMPVWCVVKTERRPKGLLPQRDTETIAINPLSVLTRESTYRYIKHFMFELTWNNTQVEECI